MLHIKAAEFFLETSQGTKVRTQQRGSAKQSGLRDAKEQIFSGIGEDPD